MSDPSMWSLDEYVGHTNARHCFLQCLEAKMTFFTVLVLRLFTFLRVFIICMLPVEGKKIGLSMD